MIAIIDYKAGNLTSVVLAFKAAGADARVTSSPEEIVNAKRVVFPGVGAAGAAMDNLATLGVVPALTGIIERGIPFLGICLGTQVLLDSSEEDGGVPCLGLIRGTANLFRPSDPSCKVPQMGWNAVKTIGRHPLFDGIRDGSEFYFLHSYYPAPDAGFALAETEYAGTTFASAIGRDNIFATQFHPERSGRVGLRLIRNFLAWDGSC